jgi:adenosylcobinamide-GDP ribazoletransferase
MSALRLPSPLRGVRAAFVFLTRIPVGGFPYADDDWRWSAAHFPLVGLALGALLGCLDHALLRLGPLAAALGAIGASLFLTGAFHEDGLADTSDALGGAHDRDKILVILKDSRIGAFGACALVMSLAGRAALLAKLGDQAAWAMPLVGAVARAAPVWQLAALPYVASPRSKSTGVGAAGRLQAVVATVWALAAGVLAMKAGPFTAERIGAVFGALLVTTVVTGWRYARRLGGVTGDFLGATEQLCELAAYAALAWTA